MPQFSFTATDSNKSKTTGIIEAETRETAFKKLSDKNLIVTNLTLIENRWMEFLNSLGFFKMKIKAEYLLVFTQELAAMLSAGITLKAAVDVVAKDAENPNLRRICIDISYGLNAGQTLSDILKQYPNVFSKLYVSMVEAGETGGKLPLILERLADYIEKTENLRKKIISAFYYPSAVVCFAILIMSFILIFGIPRFEEIYKEFGHKLPFLVGILVSASKFISSHIIIIIISLIILSYILTRILSTKPAQMAIDDFKLKTFILGPLFKRLAIAKFARTLSTLYTSGLPIVRAMDIVSGATGNLVVENIVKQSLKNLREGETLAGPLRRSKVFTNMAISMITTGEEAGNLDIMLNKLADFYEAQIDITLNALTSLLEPIVMICVGTMVGILIFILAQPFVQLTTILTN